MKLSEMQRVALAFCFLALAFSMLAQTATLPPREGDAFQFGICLFAINLALIVFLAARLFQTGGGAQRGSGLVVVLFLIKLSLLGLGAYVALVMLQLPVVGFVAGLGAGLVAVTLASFARPKAS